MKLDNEDDRRAYADQEVAKAFTLLDAGDYIASDETFRHAVHTGATAVDVAIAIARYAVVNGWRDGEPPL